MSAATPARAPQAGRFWRYNYQILAGAGYWSLAVPVAASQLVTLWMMALSSDFSQGSANRIAELMTPILGAFLTANSLAPEYRSGVGAVLACKPVSLTRVLSIRAGLGMLGAVLLTLVTLMVCNFGLKPIEVWPEIAASLPSLFFLSSLSLLFATIFRNPLGGFAIALGLWALDFALGFGVHPFLSVQGYSSAVDMDSLASNWMIGKGIQVGVGCLLWYVHQRQLPRVCRPPERRDVLKIAWTCAAVLAVYSVSGAASVVGYAYARRGHLPSRDVLWLRRYLSVYGPIPVAQAFGPAFSTYVASAGVTGRGENGRSPRVEQLRQALERWPHSVWADSIAYSLAQEEDSFAPREAVADYTAVADKYGQSPFAAKALATIVRKTDGTATEEERLRAARRIIAEYSHAPEAEVGAEGLSDYYPKKVSPAEMAAAAKAAALVAPVYAKPTWLMRQAQAEGANGQRDQALQHAREARQAAIDVQTRAQSDANQKAELLPHMAQIGSTIVESQKLIDQLQAGR
jgi:hypothetical protein